MTVTRFTAGSDSVAIAEAIAVCDWIQAEIQAMCVVGKRCNRCVVVDAVTDALWWTRYSNVRLVSRVTLQQQVRTILCSRAHNCKGTCAGRIEGLN
jgi:hypothetical protein